MKILDRLTILEVADFIRITAEKLADELMITKREAFHRVVDNLDAYWGDKDERRRKERN